MAPRQGKSLHARTVSPCYLVGVPRCDPALAANTAKRLHALTPRRIVLRLATLLSELGYDLILQVTTLSGLKN
jgi:hypothetical protein